MIGLRENWPRVRLPDRSLYGGNQGEFARKGIQVSGCGLIAAMDTLRYLWRRQPGQGFFPQDLPAELPKDEYETLTLALNRRFVKVVPPFGVNGLTLAWGMNRFFRRCSLPLRARWGTSRKKLWQTVGRMLTQDLPVILAIGPNWPRLWGKREVGLYRDPADPSPAATVCGHYVTVTGMDEDWIRVSSWGRQYYIRKAEFEHYVRTFSCNLFSSCLVLRRLDEKGAEA